jgi:hypothetical protein
MSISLYSGFVPVCLQLLGGLKTVLQKAEEHAAAQKWDTATILNLRLYPDMFTLERQVRQVCNHALGAGRVAGVALPSLPDQDNSWAEMQSRIDKTVDFLKGRRGPPSSQGSVKRRNSVLGGTVMLDGDAGKALELNRALHGRRPRPPRAPCRGHIRPSSAELSLDELDFENPWLDLPH